jgi:exodeoxyribonuclease VII large subunit
VNLATRRGTVAQLSAHLRQHSPVLNVAAARGRLNTASSAICALVRRRLDMHGRRLSVAARTLDAVSPLATLQRGYAIVTDASGAVITDVQALQPGDAIRARVARGVVDARVEHITPPPDAAPDDTK